MYSGITIDYKIFRESFSAKVSILIVLNRFHLELFTISFHFFLFLFLFSVRVGKVELRDGFL